MKSQSFAAAVAILGTSVGATPVFGVQAQIPKTLIDPSLFPKFVRYSSFAASAGTVPCAYPPYNAVAVDYININVSDTQATLYRDDAAKELILAIPGTASLEDFFTDFEFIPVPYFMLDNPDISETLTECTGCLVHSGFQGAWASADAAAKSAIRAAKVGNPDYKLIVAGYSLGAALANLAYVSLQTSGLNVEAVYTIGQPRVGNGPWADYTDSLSGATLENAGIYHRITHTSDGVPQLPPAFLGFRHPGTEYWELDAPNGVPAANTTYRCYGQEPADCNDSAGGIGINAPHGGYAGVHTTPALCSA